MSRTFLPVATRVTMLNTITILSIALLLSARITAKPNLKIIGINYEFSSYDGGNHLIFKGSVVNSGRAPAQDVKVHVIWTEYDGTLYQKFVNIGEVSQKSDKTFEIDFYVDHLITLKYHTQWVEFSERELQVPV